MRQVPQYLLIGNGRVARHFQHFFSLLKLPFYAWHRNEASSQLQEYLASSSHILLLISDEAIENFITANLRNSSALFIHFSGCLVSNQAYGAHPLMSFSDHLYDLATYQSIPFILDQDAPEFSCLLPGLMNPAVRLPKTLKPKYHALCVLSGNFSCMLWQKLFSTFAAEFNFDPALAFPYLMQLSKNLRYDYKQALTGPLIRQDMQTIEKNLAALHLDPFQDIYKSFISCYQKQKKE